MDISKGDQFRPDFLAISPNNKIPAIVDSEPADGGRPFSLFESGEILLYLAEKSGKLLSGELRERHHTLQWLFWQSSGLGPMLGQNHHFNHFAPQTIPYAIERYHFETQRLYTVMNKRLETSPWLGGDHYSIADIACWPWINAHERQRINLANYPAVNNWFERIRHRPATERAMQKMQ
ncbi:Disulfide-bond oxidoreductase YfcG [compost metagenome]